jgi:hypothetical protein
MEHHTAWQAEDAAQVKASFQELRTRRRRCACKQGLEERARRGELYRLVLQATSVTAKAVRSKSPASALKTPWRWR